MDLYPSAAVFPEQVMPQVKSLLRTVLLIAQAVAGPTLMKGS